MQKLNAAVKAAIAFGALVGAGWYFNGSPLPASQGQAPAGPVALGSGSALAPPGGANVEQERAQIQANAATMSAVLASNAADLEAARPWRDTRPRNPAVCDSMTVAGNVSVMHLAGCLPDGEYPPNVFGREANTQLLDDAMRDAHRLPTKAGLVNDFPRDVAFCDAAMTNTPRLDLWRHGCLLWGEDPPSVQPTKLDAALVAEGREPTKPGPLPEPALDSAYCATATNVRNPLMLWRHGCLKRGTFPPYYDPEKPIATIVQEQAALQASATPKAGSPTP